MTSGDEKRPRKRAFILYGLYSLVALLVLLYFKFPSDAFRDYLQSAVENRVPSVSLSVGAVDLALPPGLILKDVRLSPRGGSELLLFSADSLRVKPEAGKLLRGIPAASVHCRAYGGIITGTVMLEDRRLQGPVTAVVELNAVRLEENSALQEMLGRRVQGVLEGIVSFSGLIGDPLAGDAEIRLVARDGNVEILQPLMGLNVIEFSKLILNGDLKGGKFNLTNGDIEGPDYRGSLTGTVVPSARVAESRLNLRGSIEPFPSFFARKGASSVFNFVRQKLKKGKLNFSVQGTVGKPLVNLT
jgi:type II secretion system protein N